MKVKLKLSISLHPFLTLRVWTENKINFTPLSLPLPLDYQIILSHMGVNELVIDYH